jgi:hypothetical protein
MLFIMEEIKGDDEVIIVIGMELINQRECVCVVPCKVDEYQQQLLFLFLHVS